MDFLEEFPCLVHELSAIAIVKKSVKHFQAAAYNGPPTVYVNWRKKYKVCRLLAVVEELFVLNVVVPYRNDVLLLKKMA